MHGNTPYGGQPGSTGAGRRTDTDQPDLSADQRRHLQAGIDAVAARTREFLPDEYVVGAQITAGADGPEAMIAVQPPVGRAVSAGITPDFEDLDDGLDDSERDEVAGGLAASAALQVKQAFSENVPPVAR